VRHSNKEEAELSYNMTMEREMILKLIGLKLITIWEDDWKHQMKSFTEEYRKSLIQSVSENFIDARKALHGGRTEVFKTYCECKSPGEVIMSFDISSQYPAVMALDDYAVGVNTRKKYNIEQLTKDILNDNSIGLKNVIFSVLRIFTYPSYLLMTLTLDDWFLHWKINTKKFILLSN